MKTTIDLQTLLGFFSAAGLPPLFKTIIAFVHPSIYTIVCGHGYVDGAAACYADDRAEAVLYITLTILAVAYGLYTLAQRLKANPTPPTGMKSASIPDGSVPVIGTATGPGLQVAEVDPATTTVRSALPAKGPAP